MRANRALNTVVYDYATEAIITEMLSLFKAGLWNFPSRNKLNAGF